MATEEQPFKVIEAARPLSKHRSHYWVDLIAGLKEGQAIECESTMHRNQFYRVAAYAGMKIQTQKQLNGKFRIWRVK